jgi:hypothetical protein
VAGATGHGTRADFGAGEPRRSASDEPCSAAAAHHGAAATAATTAAKARAAAASATTTATALLGELDGIATLRSRLIAADARRRKG